jgi:hypothetical protein
MTSPQMYQNIPLPSLPYVDRKTITQFDKNAPKYQELYKQLATDNQELAIWIRQKAEKSYEDQNDQEAAANLALETIALLSNQLTLDSLSSVLYPVAAATVIPSNTIL